MKKRMCYSLIAILQIMSCISVTSRPLESYDAAPLQGSLFMLLYIHVSLYNVCLILSLLLANSFFFFRFLLQLSPPQSHTQKKVLLCSLFLPTFLELTFQFWCQEKHCLYSFDFKCLISHIFLLVIFAYFCFIFLVKLNQLPLLYLLIVYTSM